jgi:hypothetical protein
MRFKASVLSAIVLVAGIASVAPVSRATPPPTFTVFTDKNAFQAALDQLAPGTRRNINWDGISIAPAGSKFIPADQFLASRQIILDPDFPTDELLVSNDEFADRRGNYAANFPFFSPAVNFKYVEDDGQPNVFRLADLQTPGLIQGFGAIFTDVEKDSTSGLVFKDQLDREVGRFYVPAGANGQQQFLGVIFSRPVIAEADVLMGEEGEQFGSVDDISNGGTADVVVTDDFVFQASTTPIPTISSVTLRANGVLAVKGIGFVEGSRIVVNGTSHETSNSPTSPNTRLSSDTAAAFIAPGQTARIQVVNPDGTISKVTEFSS